MMATHIPKIPHLLHNYQKPCFSAPTRSVNLLYVCAGGWAAYTERGSALSKFFLQFSTLCAYGLIVEFCLVNCLMLAYQQVSLELSWYVEERQPFYRGVNIQLELAWPLERYDVYLAFLLPEKC